MGFLHQWNEGSCKSYTMPFSAAGPACCLNYFVVTTSSTLVCVVLFFTLAMSCLVESLSYILCSWTNFFLTASSNRMILIEVVLSIPPLGIRQMNSFTGASP